MAVLTNFTVGAINDFLSGKDGVAPAPSSAPKKRGRPKKEAPVVQTEGEQPELVLPEDV